MIRAAVLGSPISHSLSPTLHNHAYEILGIPGKYEAIEISEVEFPQFFAEATALDASVDWRGFSLTMPLKEIVTNSLIGVDPLAKRISSANTILIDRNSQEVNVKILSTDVLGFRTIFDRIIKCLLVKTFYEDFYYKRCNFSIIHNLFKIFC